jgi:hypothetical protein
MHLIESPQVHRRFHDAAMSRHRDLFSADAMGVAYEALYDRHAARTARDTACSSGQAA